MAPTPPPQIGSLDFKEIKQNLISYLQGQSIIKDYNFEGSVVQTLIDLLAYNTFYYSYYTNMIASEMFLDSAQRLDSVISLTKPLGYAISGKRSSRAKIVLSGLLNESPVGEHSLFFGINEDGIQYTFYTLEENADVFDSDATLTLVEGTLVNNVSAISSFDFEKQKFYILDADIDISTIRVKVTHDDVTDEWKLKSNIGSLSNADDKIYFVERINTEGFAVQFGIENTLGRSLVDGDDTLEIRYLRSSGKIANGISIFSQSSNPPYTCGICSISLISASSTGLDEPSLPLIKFLAPKYFAAQNRAVTKNDYNGLLLDMGLISDINTATVFGGEEIYPPKYGRVFISLSDNLPEGVTVPEIINRLREKSVITVFPEYVAANYLFYFTDFSLGFTDPFTTPTEKTSIINSIKTLIQNEFIKPQENKFNSELDSTSISDFIIKKFPKLDIRSDDFSFFFRKEITSDQQSSYFNLGNELDVKSGFDSITLTTPFFNQNLTQVVLKLITTPNTNRFRFMNLTQVSATSGQIIQNAPFSGRVRISDGTVEIPNLTTTSYVLTIPFKNSRIKASLNNVVNFVINKVNIK